MSRLLTALLVLGWTGVAAAQDEPLTGVDNACVDAGGMGAVCADQGDCAARAFATACVQHEADDPASRRCEVPCEAEEGGVPDEALCSLGETCVAAAGDGAFYCRPSAFRMDLNLLDQCVAHFLEGTPPVLSPGHACSLERNLARLLDQDGNLTFDIFDVDLCIRAFLDQPSCDGDAGVCPDDDLRFCREDDDCGEGLYCDPDRNHCTRECGLVAARELGFTVLERGCAGRLKSCDFSRGRCEDVDPAEASCQVDGQCPSGSYCFLGRCAPTCSRGLDCPDSSWFCTDNGRCRVQPAPEGDPGFVFEPKNYAVLFGNSSLALTAIEAEQAARLLIMDLTTKREVRNNPSVGFGYRLEITYSLKQEAKCLEDPEDWSLEDRDDCLIDPSEEFVTPLAPFGTVFAAGRPEVRVRLNEAATGRLSPGSYVATVNAIFDNGSQDRFRIHYDKLTPSGTYEGTMTVSLGGPENTLEGRTPLMLAARLHIKDEEVRWNQLLSDENLTPAGGEDLVDLTRGRLVHGKLQANQALAFALPGARTPADNEVPVKGLYSPRDGMMRLIGVVDLAADFCRGEDGPCDGGDGLEVDNPFGRAIRRVFQLAGTYEDATRRYYGLYRERVSGLVPGADLTLDGAFLLDQTEFDPSELTIAAPLLAEDAPVVAFPETEDLVAALEAEELAACGARQAAFEDADAYVALQRGAGFPVHSDLVEFEALLAEALTDIGAVDKSERMLTLYDYLAGWIVPCGAEHAGEGVLGRGSPTACVDTDKARCGLALHRKALLSGFVLPTDVDGPGEAELPLFCRSTIPVEGCDVDPETQSALATLYEHNRFHQELAQATKFYADRELSDAFFTLYRHRANPFAQGAALSYKSERLRAAFASYGELLDLYLSPSAAGVLWLWPMAEFQGRGNEWLRQMQVVVADRLEVQRQLVDLRRRLFAGTDRNDRLFAEHLAQVEYLVQVYLLALQRRWQGPGFASTGRGAEVFATLQKMLLQLHESKNPLGVTANQVYFESRDPSRSNWHAYLARLVGEGGDGGLMAQAELEVDEAVAELQASLRDVDALEDRIFAARQEYEDTLVSLCGPETLSDAQTVCDRMLARLAAGGELDPSTELEKVCEEAAWPDAILPWPLDPHASYGDQCDAVVDLFRDSYDAEAACPLPAAGHTVLVRGRERVCLGGEMGALLQERQVLRTEIAAMTQPMLRAWEDLEAYLAHRHDTKVIEGYKTAASIAMAVINLIIETIQESTIEGTKKVKEMLKSSECVFIAGFSVGTDCPQKIGAGVGKLGLAGIKWAVFMALHVLHEKWDTITEALLSQFDTKLFHAQTEMEAGSIRRSLGAALDGYGATLQALASVELRIVELEYTAQHAADRLDDELGMTLDHLVGRETGSVLVGNQWVGRSAKTFAEVLSTAYRMVMAFTHRYNLPADESSALVARVLQAVTFDDVWGVIDTVVGIEDSYCGREGLDCDAFNNVSVLRFSLRDELFPGLRDLVDPRTGRVVTRGEQFHNLVGSPPYLRRRIRGNHAVDQIELPFTVWLQMLDTGGLQRWMIDPTQCNHLVDAPPGGNQVLGTAGTVAVNVVGRNLDDLDRSVKYELARGHADQLRSCYPEPVVREVGTAPVLDYPVRTQVVGYAPQSVPGMQPSPPTFVTRSAELPACVNQPEAAGQLVGAGCWRFFGRDRSLAAPDWMLTLPLRIGGAETTNTWLAGEGLPEETRPVIEDIVLYVRYRSRPIQDY